MSECPQVGNAGLHSKAYYDDGSCQWCGENPEGEHMVKFEIMQAFMTGEGSIGYRRTDLPLVHVIAQAPAGTAFEVASHFKTCEVCRAHEVTEEAFHEWAKVALSWKVAPVA